MLILVEIAQDIRATAGAAVFVVAGVAVVVDFKFKIQKKRKKRFNRVKRQCLKPLETHLTW